MIKCKIKRTLRETIYCYLSKKSNEPKKKNSKVIRTHEPFYIIVHTEICFFNPTILTESLLLLNRTREKSFATFARITCDPSRFIEIMNKKQLISSTISCFKQIFTLYSSPIEDIVKRYPVSGMFYADDSQLYVSLNPTDISATLTELENCIKEIKNWTLENKLALNDSKTEVVYLSSRFSETVPIPSINVGDSVVDTVAKAKDLGVIIDQHLTLVPHVNNISRLASHSIRNIGRIRKYLDRNSTEKLVHAFVSSRLDSNNSILYGLPKLELSKLQRIQNAAARLVTLSKKREHITPVLKDLHWLPVESRIIYKLMLLTFKALNNQAPKYLSELISIKKPSRSLRSNTSIVLHRKKANTVTYGQRSFHHAAPELWNQLPSHVKNATSLQQFKSLLKAHLFSK